MGADATDEAARLIRQIAGGNREAFGRLYDQFAGIVFAFAVRLLRDRSEAEDLLQEVFLHVWRQAGAYDQAKGSPMAWISTLTRSRGIDRLRSRRRREKGLVPFEEFSGSMAGDALDRGATESEARLVVQDALSGLPESQRKVLELAYFGGLTQSEIAAHLGEALGTVKTRIRAGLNRLRTLLGTETIGGEK